MADEFAHEREDFVIVGCGRQDEAVIAEGILHGLGHVFPGQVAGADVFTAEGGELFGQLFRGFLCVSVNGGVSDKNAGILRAVGRPGIILVDIISDVFL